MKINHINKRSETCYNVSVETENGECFVFDFPYNPSEQEIESFLRDTIQQNKTLE